MTEMKRYKVGIDLGTSNTVLAYAEAGNASEPIRVFEIEQLVSPGEVAARPLLPSVRYHAAAGELDAGDLQLPWTATVTATATATEAAPLPFSGRACRKNPWLMRFSVHGAVVGTGFV